MQKDASGPEASKNASPAKPPKKKGFHWRSATSFTLAGVFLVMLCSGVILYLSPRGRTAHWTDWTMFKLSKDQWTSLHINISILFIAASIFHLVLNWKLFWGYIRKKTTGNLNRKSELGVAVLLTLVFAIGSAAVVQPFKAVMDVSEYIKDVWESDGAPPIPHGEELAVNDFATQVGIDPAEFLAALEEEGYTVEDPAVTTIRDTAATKGEGNPPSQLFEDLKKHFPKLGQTGTGTGFGTMTIEDFAAEVGLETTEVVAFLESEGCEIDDPSETQIRDVAKSKGVMPPELMELLKGRFPEIGTSQGSGEGTGTGGGRNQNQDASSTAPNTDSSSSGQGGGRGNGAGDASPAAFGGGGGAGGGSGFGTMTVEGFADQAGLETSDVVSFLESEGCDIDDPASTTIRDAAQSMGVMPPELMELIREQFPEI